LITIMHFYIFLIKRYLGGRGNKIFSSNAWLSFIGVFIGCSLLVVVLSVFNGFQQQIRESIFKFDPHIIIETRKGPGKIDDWKDWRSTIKANLGDLVSNVSGMIQSPALIRKDDQIDQVLIRGVEYAEDITNKTRYVLPNDFPKNVEPTNLKGVPKGDYCLVGKELGTLLDLHVGDYIQLIVPKGQFTTRVGVEPGMKSYTISGFFASGNYQYDSRVILLSLPTAQGLFGTGDTVQQLAVKLTKFSDLKKVMLELYKILPYDFSPRSIEQEHRNLFSALKWEKIIMTVIVFLFIIAALVGIIVSTSNVIRSKRKDIGILKALGASDQEILIVFTMIGFLSGLVGTIFGVAFGIFLSMRLEWLIGTLEKIANTLGSFYCEHVSACYWVKVELMPRDVYYFDHMPVSIDASLLHPLAVLAIFLAGMAALIPAWAAGKLQPAEIIRSSDT